MAQSLTLPHSPAQVDISVIIPTYKPQDYFWECLDSLAAQTLEPERFEVTVVLNGCNEPYKSLIQEHISSGMQHLNVRLVQTDTPGVSNARNMGIDMANGTYLTFIDDDDYVSPPPALWLCPTPSRSPTAKTRSTLIITSTKCMCVVTNAPDNLCLRCAQHSIALG